MNNTSFSPVFQAINNNELVPLSQWPSTAACYAFEAKDKAPFLQIHLQFNAAAYTFGPDVSTTEEQREALKQKAATDLLIYLKLAAQLSNAEKFGALFITSLENTVDAEKKISANKHAVDATVLVNKFIIPVIDLLKSAATGEAIPADAISFTITHPVDMTNIATLPAIMQLGVNVVLQSYENMAGVAKEAVTAIQPQFADGSLSAKAFARQFEAAFINQPGAGIVFKLAVENSGNANAPLWLIRFDTGGCSGLKYSIDASQAAYFAPLPLAANLQSFTADIKQYISGQSFPAGSDAQDFSGIDMDAWANQLLAAIDKFLTPDYAVPALLLHASNIFSGDPDYLQTILDARQQLADAISRSVTSVFINEEEESNEAIESAREAWKEQLQSQLASAYAAIASVQASAVINSGFKDKTAAPFFKGSMQSREGQGLAPAKLALADGNTFFNYLYSPALPGEAYSFPLTEISYNPDQVGVPTQEGALKLSFIIPVNENIGDLASPLTAMGAVEKAEIPAPIRSFPVPPQVIGHSYEPAQPAETTIQNARSWNYSFTYKTPVAAQDSITVEIKFNSGTVEAEPMSHATNELCPALARFACIYPAISADFDASLVKLGPDTLVSTSPVAINSRYALQAFAETVKEAAGQWNMPGAENEDVVLKSPAPQNNLLGFKISECVDLAGDLLLAITPANGDPENAGLSIAIPGYACEPDLNHHVYRYYRVEGNTKVYLAYKDRNKEPLRTLVVAGLDVLNIQNAGATLAVQRNEKLLQNEDGGWKITNPGFTYKTNGVCLPGSVVPRLSTHNIDISNITTEQYPIGGMRSIAAHLSAMFDALLENAAMDSYAAQLECKYTFKPKSSELITEIPIAIAAPRLEKANRAKDVADGLAATIQQWFETSQPETYAGGYNFYLSLYSEIDPAEVVLQLQLRLDITSIAGNARA